MSGFNLAKQAASAVIRTTSPLITTPKLMKITDFYSAEEKTMIVGEAGNDFAQCVAKALNSANNITSTTFEPEALLKVWFPKFEENISEFKALGGRYIPSIDATKLCEASAPHWINYKTEKETYVPVSDRVKKFKKLICNFPFVGDKLDGKSPWKSETPEMLKLFFMGSSQVIEADGYVDVTVNMAIGWKDWNIVEIAKKAGLKLVHTQEFDPSVFPGYIPRRGCGDNPNAEFPLRDARFFRFGLIDHP